MNGTLHCFGEQLQNNAVSVFGFSGFVSVRVKGGMSVRNSMRRGLRNDVITQNLIYAK